MIKRQRFAKIPIQGNFYPMAAAGYIEDSHHRMTILTAQPLGISSLASGQLEVSYKIYNKFLILYLKMKFLKFVIILFR